VPIYEFRCARCGAGFEELVAAGTERVPCHECGDERAERIYSRVAEPFRLVKSHGEARRQEGRNAELRKAAKARFSAARRRARQARGPGAT
jgi:putative FmdB family regulatory protein